MKGITMRRGLWSLATALAVASALLGAQGGGGGGGSRSGGAPRPRLTAMTDAFTLDEAQRKQVKTLLDAEHKKAEPLRKALIDARAGIGAAIEANQTPAEIDAVVKAYAAHAASMAHAEMRALAQVLKVLTETQRANQPAIDATFFMMRGALFDKKWDAAPGGRGY